MEEVEINFTEEISQLQSRVNLQNQTTTSLSKEIHDLSQLLLEAKQKLEEEKKNRGSLEQTYWELDARLNFLNSNISSRKQRNKKRTLKNPHKLKTPETTSPQRSETESTLSRITSK